MALTPKFEIYECTNGWLLNVRQANDSMAPVMDMAKDMMSKFNIGGMDEILNKVQDQNKEKKKGIVGSFLFPSLKELFGFINLYFEDDKQNAD